MCLTCGARARSVVVEEGRRTRHERLAAIILVEVTRFAREEELWPAQVSAGMLGGQSGVAAGI